MYCKNELEKKVTLFSQSILKKSQLINDTYIRFVEMHLLSPNISSVISLLVTWLLHKSDKPYYPSLSQSLYLVRWQVLEVEPKVNSQ